MSLELHRLLLPFARSFEVGKSLEDPCIFLVLLKISRYFKTVQNSCIRKVSIHRLAHTYALNIHEDVFLFCWSRKLCAVLQWCDKKFWMIYVYLTIETWNLFELSNVSILLLAQYLLNSSILLLAFISLSLYLFLLYLLV